MEVAWNLAWHQAGAMAKKRLMEPFELVEIEPGEFSLLTSVFEPADEVFETFGRQGGGHDWSSVALFLLANDAEHLDPHIELDSEAGMFVANSQNRDALTEFGKLLSGYFNNPTKLRTLIGRLPEDPWS